MTSQGDFVQGSAAARAALSIDGTGVTVGILSDSYDCYKLYAEAGSGVPATGNMGYAANGFNTTAEGDIGTGDLPAATSINILQEGGAGPAGQGTCAFDAQYFLPDSDEGRAMMQVVHDVAPGAKLAFYTAANTEADFATGIQALATAGAQVIADDVSYFDEPFSQDGLGRRGRQHRQRRGRLLFPRPPATAARTATTTLRPCSPTPPAPHRRRARRC